MNFIIQKQIYLNLEDASGNYYQFNLIVKFINVLIKFSR